MTERATAPGGSEPTGMTPLKRAFIALEETRAQLAAVQAAANEPIAVIGLACRVPGAADSAEFWALMRDGVDATGPLPSDRWDVAARYDPDPETPGCIAARGGGFLPNVRGFDPGLFGISRREAQGMDPQQRLLLEVAWEALEHAGQPPDGLQKSATGVYVGVTGSDYAYLQLETGDEELLDAHFASGIAHSITSGRLSYLLGLQGPALTIDTACSSSLVAVHLACQALRAGDCRMALAGGVNLILSPDLYVALSRSRMLAPDGRCKTFDASADGFARGEGCGVVVLKRLSQARADGDRVLAVIRGSAVNQDGPSSGLTAPNGPAQEAVIRAALARAGIAPSAVGYVEAHGTGTELGDPLEVSALGAVFGPGRDPARPLLVGSVKTNIGHLEAAAGVTGLIKLVLSLRAGQLPAHLHFRTPSPHIAWDEWPVQVPTGLRPWQPIDGQRIAGVSSFGFSGTNAHVVVGEAPPIDAPAATASPRTQLFVLSARDVPSLARMADRCASAFAALDDAALPDVCFSAAAGRAHLPQRATFVANSLAQLRAQLAGLAEGRLEDGVKTARVVRRDPARVAFLFTGQGAQYAGMAQALDAEEPVFRAALDRCAAVLDARLPRPLRELLHGDGAAGLLDETGCTQPALFAVEYALSELWRSWGVSPAVVIGHSVGEVVAACIAGTLSLEDGLALISERGRLMQALPAGGAMAAVFASGPDVSAALSGPVSIAAYNGPLQTVISGAADAVDAVCTTLTAGGVRCQRLPVSHAFHSPLVEPMLEPFEAAVARIALRPPRLPLVSNLTGKLVEPSEFVQPRYWRRHVREAVRFADGVTTLAGLHPDVYLEIGPHPTLLPAAQATVPVGDAQASPAFVPSLRKGRADHVQLLDALGALYLAGVAVDWRAVWSARPHRWADLPGYAFQREPFWFQARPASASRGPGRGDVHPLLGRRVRAAQQDVVLFEQTLAASTLPYLADHRVNGSAILPATAFLELGSAVAQQVFDGARVVHDVAIVEPLRLGDDEARVVQVLVRRDDDAGEASFEVWSTEPDRDDAPWRRHAEGRIGGPVGIADHTAVEAVAGGCVEDVDVASHFAALATRGLDFGPSLRGLRRLRRGDGEALGEAVLPEPSVAGRGPYCFHPALLDACLQVMNTALDAGQTSAARAYLPLSLRSVEILRTPGTTVWSHARVARDDGNPMLRADVTVLDADGVVARLRGIALRPAAATEPDAPFFTVDWQPAPLGDAEWMPAPTALHAAVGGHLSELATEHRLSDYQRGFVELEAICAGWIFAALFELGWRPSPGDVVDADRLTARLGVVPRYRRLLARLLEILAEDGWLRPCANGWTVTKAPPAASQEALARDCDALADRQAGAAHRMALAQRCGPELAAILRGAVDPLQQLFPDGSTELAEALYRDAPEARAFNGLVRDAVRAALTALPAGRRLRVLEVGGGTGGTTAWVAPVLPADRCEYLFTDVGPSLVSRAREKFSTHGFMSFQTLDLEQPAAAQGLGDRSFDIVIASNVVHATADLRRTLARLRERLVPGGTLLMLEVAGRERWIDITFGLTEGWWRFVDTDLRPAYPLLSRPAWLDLLASCGFEAAAIGAEDERSREVLLAARRPLADANKPPPGAWLVLGGGDGLGAALAQRLRGPDRVVVEAGAASVVQVRELVIAHATTLAGIVHLAPLDLASPYDERCTSQRPVLGTLLEAVQALGASSQPAAGAPRLFVVTRGAMGAPAATVHAEQAAAVGMGRTIALEHPELRCTCIDLDPATPAPTQADALFARLAESNGEGAIALRDATALVPRLLPYRAGVVEASPLRLEKGAGGTFDALALVPAPQRMPGPGQVALRVVAAGLNFRDVMNAVAMRDDPEPLGGECAGRVIAVGAGVSGIAPGDHVVAIAEGSFATHTIADAALVRRIPDGLSFADAATLPFAFMTADHALHTLGGMSAGETVLIHAGAGGVGMAAIQLARLAGARVIATAGSDAKRAVLRGLGVAAALDSRSLAFETQVLELTQGRGVDIVLNSLAGDFIGANVRCLGNNGRFLEIGKRDIWSAERFAQERPHGRYHAIDLAALRLQDPVETAALFRRTLERIERGELRPLPLRTFPLTSAREAFRHMAAARHVGKVVLTCPDVHRASLEELDEQGTYLVTGGLSGLGLLTARRLVDRGARHVLLVGRRPPAAQAQQSIDALRAIGAHILTLQADVADPAAVRKVLDAVPAGRPLRGVVHCAGTLDDGALVQQSWDRFAVPLGPKIDGGWALHALTRHMRLDFFVLYSSMAALGSSGQANHAAANAFLDALAWQRRAEGLAALSIDWGAWSDVGAAADRMATHQFESLGIDPIVPERGLDWLEQLMASGAGQVAVFPARWAVFGSTPQGRGALFDGLRSRRTHEAPTHRVAPVAPGTALVESLRDAAPARRHELLLGFVAEHVAKVIDAATVDAIDPRQPLNELGLDSLMAVELRNRLGTGLGLPRRLPATLVFDHPTLEALARYLATEIQPQTAETHAETPAPVQSDAVGAIDEMSDDEVERLFANRMQGNRR